jgi:hypothetical protein
VDLSECRPQVDHVSQSVSGCHYFETCVAKRQREHVAAHETGSAPRSPPRTGKLQHAVRNIQADGGAGALGRGKQQVSSPTRNVEDPIGGTGCGQVEQPPFPAPVLAV